MLNLPPQPLCIFPWNYCDVNYGSLQNAKSAELSLKILLESAKVLDDQQCQAVFSSLPIEIPTWIRPKIITEWDLMGGRFSAFDISSRKLKELSRLHFKRRFKLIQRQDKRPRNRKSINCLIKRKIRNMSAMAHEAVKQQDLFGFKLMRQFFPRFLFLGSLFVELFIQICSEPQRSLNSGPVNRSYFSRSCDLEENFLIENSQFPSRSDKFFVCHRLRDNDGSGSTVLRF